jgi:hypothetical protein
MRPESLIPKSAVATAPQRCELFVNYFTVLLTGCGSPLMLHIIYRKIQKK